jgi:Zn-dependent protease
MHDHPSPDSIYRCNRCGIESSEPTCFLDGETRAPSGLAVTCITCTQSRRSSPGLRLVAGLFGAIGLPIFFLLALEPNAKRQIVTVVIAAFVMQPLIVVLHELGHFVTARFLGLQASLITLGAGDKLWSGRILGVPLRVHGWPLLGMTYLGSTSLRWLRLRVWLTVLMGPATNLLLIAAAAGLWTSLVRLLGTDIMILWILYNGILVVGNLVPRSTSIAGQRHRTDGMQLLLDATPNATPEVRAVAANNIALALWLGDLHLPVAAQSTARADALSNRAYAMYPCVLPYRSTRALLLTATDRAEEALTLLGYCNYDRGSKADRGDQEAARAFALRHLNRRQEADQALAAALRLNTTRRYWLTRLGLLPMRSANETAPS